MLINILSSQKFKARKMKRSRCILVLFFIAVGFWACGNLNSSCAICKGSGETDCAICDNGTSDCAVCVNGRTEFGTCAFCNGRGDSKCNFCNGIGKNKCTFCNGTGKSQQNWVNPDSALGC